MSDYTGTLYVDGEPICSVADFTFRPPDPLTKIGVLKGLSWRFSSSFEAAPGFLAWVERLPRALRPKLGKGQRRSRRRHVQAQRRVLDRFMYGEMFCGLSVRPAR